MVIIFVFVLVTKMALDWTGLIMVTGLFLVHFRLNFFVCSV